MLPVPIGMWRGRSARTRPAPLRPRTARRCRWRRCADPRRCPRPHSCGRSRSPVVEVGSGQRDIAGRAGRAAGRVDPDDLGRRRAEVGADRVIRRARIPDLLLVGERQPCDVREPAGVRGRVDAGRRQLLPVEGRALEQVGELRPVGRVVDGELLRPRPGLDLGRAASPGLYVGGSYSTASSASAAIREAERPLPLLGEVGEEAGGAGEDRHAT